MFSHYSTKAIVLDERGISEADKGFTVFSEDFGLIEVVGRSIRKIDSKLKGAMTPFTVSLIEFIQGRRYKILIYSEEKERLEGIRTDLSRLRTAYKMRESLRRLVGGEKRDPRLWGLILTSFREIEGSPSSVPSLYLTYLYLVWGLVSYLGYKPELYNCTLCGEEAEGSEIYFSREGVVCQSCGKGFRVDERLIMILREIDKTPLQRFRKFKLEREEVEGLERLVESLLVDI